MAAPDPKRPTYTVEAIPSDVKNGLFLGNAAVDTLMAQDGVYARLFTLQARGYR